MPSSRIEGELQQECVREASSSPRASRRRADGVAVEPVRLPPVRWLVDGMNVIGTRPDAWWRDRHAAMVRLVDLLERWAAADGEGGTGGFEQPPSPPLS